MPEVNTEKQVKKQIELDMAGIKAKILKKLKSEVPAITKKKPGLKAEKKYVMTGIPGFDALFDRGIPKGKSVIVAGGPGTAKTVLCLQTIAFGCEKGEKCIYLSLEESEESLIGYMRDFGWDPDKWIKNGQLIIKRFDPFEISKIVSLKEKDKIITEINKMVPEGFKPDRLVLDSITAVAAGFTGKEDEYRLYIEYFFRFLEKLKINSFLVTETEQIPKKFAPSGEEEFLADGIIVMYNFRKKNLRIRAIEILKLRGTKHENRLIPFNVISGKGIIAYPLEEIYTTMEKEE